MDVVKSSRTLRYSPTFFSIHMAYSVALLLTLRAALFTRTESAYRYSDRCTGRKIWPGEMFCTCPLYDTRISSNCINKKHKTTFKIRTNRQDFNVGHWIAIPKPQKAHNHSEFYTKQAEISPCCAPLLKQMVLLTSGTTSWRFVILSSSLLTLINAEDSNSKLFHI